MNKNNTLFWLLSIIFFGCCLQLLFLFVFMNPHVLEWFDPNDYYSIAKSLAGGNSYSIDINNLYRSPGYPYFLSFIISVVGSNILFIRLVHIGFYAIFLIGVYYLGKEWKGVKFGLLLTFICSLYPYFIYLPLTLYPEALLIFISSWIIYFLLRIVNSFSYYNLFIACFFISVGVLTRPTYIIIAFTFLLYLIVTKALFLNKLKVLVFLIIIPVSILSSWGYRNLKMHDHFIISTAGNKNLYLSFNENATIYTKSDCPIPEKTQKKLALAKNIFEQDSIYKASAIEFIKQNKLHSFYLASVRVIDLWNPIPHTSTNYSLLKKILSSIPYSMVLLFSFLGFYSLRKESFSYLLIAIFVLNTIANGIFAASVRYRLIFDIILIMFATYYLYSLALRYKEKKLQLRI
ncbi:MAG: glycosyltransferase family 39 protein [Bacteroidaceae bacterium]|nr:glycosyltransferase family 39 protein [Bacteroidaceae bacterium]